MKGEKKSISPKNLLPFLPVIKIWNYVARSNLYSPESCLPRVLTCPSWVGWKRRSPRFSKPGFQYKLGKQYLWKKSAVQVAGGSLFKHHLLCTTAIPQKGLNSILPIKLNFIVVEICTWNTSQTFLVFAASDWKCLEFLWEVNSWVAAGTCLL